MDALFAHLQKHVSDPTEMLRKTRDNLGGAVIGNLRRYLYEYAGGICIVCEQNTQCDKPGQPNSAEVGHIIPASLYAHSKVRAGYVPGNVANMCKECNRAAQDFPFHLHLEMIRADLIPTEWPSFRKQWNGISDHSAEARKIRAGKGLPF